MKQAIPAGSKTPPRSPASAGLDCRSILHYRTGLVIDGSIGQDIYASMDSGGSHATSSLHERQVRTKFVCGQVM